LNNNDISTSSKAKISTSTNDIKAFNKKALKEEIRRLTITNIQLINNKLNAEITKIKLEANKTKLINEKNILITKREKLQAKLTEAVVISIISI